VVDALSRKFVGYLVALLTQQLSLLREIEKMQIEVLIKEPRLGISHMNQISIRFDLYEKIKKAQQKDDQIAKNIEMVQKDETQDFTIVRALLKKYVYLQTLNSRRKS